MNQTGYIYRVTNRENGRVYIGQRWGEFDPNYYGSGTIIRRSVAKRGREAFTLEFIQSAFSADDINRLEIHYIAQEKARALVYNIAPGGQTSGRGPTSEATRRRLSLAMKTSAKYANSRGAVMALLRGPEFRNSARERASRPESRLQMAELHEWQRTDEGRRIHAEAQKKSQHARANIERLVAANTGRPLSAEHRAGIGAVHRGKPKSEEQRRKMSAARYRYLSTLTKK